MEESQFSAAPDANQDVCNALCMRFLPLSVSDPKRSSRRCHPEISSSTEKTQRNIWEPLPRDVQDMIVAGLPLQKVFQFQLVTKAFLDIINQPTFLQSRLQFYPTEGNFSPMVFFNDLMSGWHWLGFDLISNQWRRLPSLSFLATPDADLVKEFFVAGNGSLLCVNVSKQPGVARLIICNPLTRATRELPPMNFPRQPVLMNMLLDKDTNNYKVIVAGSAAMGSEELSRKTEVYDSVTRKWKVTDDVPGPVYALNDYQIGAFSKLGVLCCLGFISAGNSTTLGMLAYDVENEKWIHNSRCTLPSLDCEYSPLDTTQIFECEGSIFLYMEQKHISSTLRRFSVAKLESLPMFQSSVLTQRTTWSVLVNDSKPDSGDLWVHPEYLCVGHGTGRVCILDTLNLTGSVYNIEDQPPSRPSALKTIPKCLSGGLLTSLEASGKAILEDWSDGRSRGGIPLFSALNALSFSFEPSFHTSV